MWSIQPQFIQSLLCFSLFDTVNEPGFVCFLSFFHLLSHLSLNAITNFFALSDSIDDCFTGCLQLSHLLLQATWLGVLLKVLQASQRRIVLLNSLLNNWKLSCCILNDGCFFLFLLLLNLLDSSGWDSFLRSKSRSLRSYIGTFP